MISLIYSVERSYGRSYEQAATFGEQTKEVISPLKAPGLHKTKPSKAKAQKQYRDLNSFSNHCFFPFFNAGIFWDLASGIFWNILEYSEIWHLAVRSKNLISRINCCLRGIVAGLPIPFPPHNLRQLRVLPICHNPSFLCLKNAPQFHLIYHKKHLYSAISRAHIN